MNGHFPLGDINPLKYFYLVATSAGLLFALIDSSDHLPFYLHLIVWQLQAFIPISAIIGSHLLLSQFTPFNQSRHWLQLLWSGIAGSLLFSPLALLIDIYLVGEGLPENLLLEWLDELAAVLPPVTLFWLLINLPWLMGLEYTKRIAATKPADDIAQADPQRPQFFALTAISRTSDIISMSAQLHYLEIVTQQDKVLILYSLAKAVEELPDELGIQIHRSHWVALQNVTKFKKTGRQGQVTLTNNTQLPVSRSHLAQVTTRLAKTNGAKSN